MANPEEYHAWHSTIVALLTAVHAQDVKQFRVLLTSLSQDDLVHITFGLGAFGLFYLQNLLDVVNGPEDIPDVLREFALNNELRTLS